MGAERVEAAVDLKNVVSKDLSQFDYVVFKDLESRDDKQFLKNMDVAVQCVDVPWVKECLYANRLVDVPERWRALLLVATEIFSN